MIWFKPWYHKAYTECSPGDSQASLDVFLEAPGHCGGMALVVPGTTGPKQDCILESLH